MNKRDVEFLFEMGQIRYIQRFWRRFLTPEFENLAEHTFRVAWIALSIAAHEKNVDTGKMLKMALVHDITESRAGDVDYVSRQFAERNEEDAIEEMFKGTKLAAEFVDLWKEYEERGCIEAKIVKDADNIDVDMELQEQAARGSAIKKAFDKTRAQVGATKLYTATGKKLWKAIRVSDPHAWHINSKNRINAGDWKK